MKRAGLAALGLGVLAFGALLMLRWPSKQPALDCDPSEVRLDDAGIARCGPGAKLAAAQVLTVGGKLDLNTATADELGVISGVGPQLAKAIVDERTRLGKFENWEQIDQVPGVGETRLAALRSAAEIR